MPSESTDDARASPVASIDLNVQLVAVRPVYEVREIQDTTLRIACQLPHVQQRCPHRALQVLRGERVGRNGVGLPIRGDRAVTELVERNEHRVDTQAPRAQQWRELFRHVDRCEHHRVVAYRAQSADQQHFLAELRPFTQQERRGRDTLEGQQLRARVGTNPTQVVQQPCDLARRPDFSRPLWANVPLPRRRTMLPSAARRASALRTVVLDTPYWRTSVGSLGSASPAAMLPAARA